MTSTADQPTEPVALVEDDIPRELPDQPRHRSRVSHDDLIDIGSAAMVGAAGAGILREVLNWQGLISTGIWFYLLFLLVYFALQRIGTSNEVGIDRVVTVLIYSAGLLVLAVLGWMLVFLALRGYHRIAASFFTQDMAKVGPLNPGGGVKAAIIGSAEQVGIATVVVVPLATLTAIYLHEIKGRLAGPVSFAVNALAGLPSIVAGLIVYTVWVVQGHGFSGVAGSAALAILMLPFITRAAEEILRTVPDSLREASLALGAPQWRVVMRVIVPTALAGLTTAVILGVALGVGETAPLLLTTGFSGATNANPASGSQTALTTFVETYVKEPNAAQNQRGYTALFILVLLVLALFILARYFGGRSARRLGRAR